MGWQGGVSVADGRATVEASPYTEKTPWRDGIGKPDAIVADIGACIGYFSIPIAERVPQRTVLAVDIQAEMRAVGLSHVRTEAFLPQRHFMVFEKPGMGPSRP